MRRRHRPEEKLTIWLPSLAENNLAPSLAKTTLHQVWPKQPSFHILSLARTLVLLEITVPYAKLLFNQMLSLFSMVIPDMVSSLFP